MALDNPGLHVFISSYKLSPLCGLGLVGYTYRKDYGHLVSRPGLGSTSLQLPSCFRAPSLCSSPMLTEMEQATLIANSLEERPMAPQLTRTESYW